MELDDVGLSLGSRGAGDQGPSGGRLGRSGRLFGVELDDPAPPDPLAVYFCTNLVGTLAAGDRRRGPVGGGAVPGVLRGADSEREDAGGVRAGGRAIPRVVRGGLRDVSPLQVAAHIRTHPGSVPTVKNPAAAVRGSEARRHQGGDARPLGGGGEEASRDDQAARRGCRAAAVDVLPHVPGDRDHGVPVERRGRWSTRSKIAGHASPKAKLYDRTSDTVTVDEIERIVI